MPGNNSASGRWSGDDRFYAKVINFGKTIKGAAKAQKILDEGNYCYSFGDGWMACVSVREVTGNESRSVRRKSNGFCGYDWMVNSIRYDGAIFAPK